MRKLKEILRLKHEAKLTNRQIGKSINISASTVSRYTNAFDKAGFTWPLPETIGDLEFEEKVFGTNTQSLKERQYIIPDWVEIHEQLKTKGSTLQLFWEQYYDQYGEQALGYSQYCTRFREWSKSRKISMRQIHKGGEKLFVDYSGQTIPVFLKNGEQKKAEIFIAVLGASNFTYAEATFTQSLPCWIGSHVRGLFFFGGVPEIIVPDNLRSGVSKAHLYDPDINPTYHHFSVHYAVTIIPARPYRPKDKAKAEVGVQIVERWILAKLRQRKFFSLDELNVEIKRLLEKLNNKQFQKLPGNRIEQFNKYDKPFLKSLPVKTYTYTEVTTCRVPADYHLNIDYCYYSVPYQLIRKKVDVHLKEKTITVFHKGKLIVIHPRFSEAKNKNTVFEHMPESHKKYTSRSSIQIVDEAKKTGPYVESIVSILQEKGVNPEKIYRQCCGLISLGKKHSESRLELACKKAVELNRPYLKNIESILRNNLEKVPTELIEETIIDEHENVRGPSYYSEI